MMKNKLEALKKDELKKLITKILLEQVIIQRENLHFFRDLTFQPAQIDTGYIGQHLVSLVTRIPGGGFRGKGLDLADGSEVKSANFLDSMDANGSVAPRWNFTCNDVGQMLSFLEYPMIYLVSMDENADGNFRFRVWGVSPKKNTILKARYEEWMKVLGYPKLEGEDRKAVNFQLFPPRNKTSDDFARHGNGRSNGFSKLEVPLQGVDGAELLLHCEIIDRKIIYHHFN
jgi:hypothetical protein